MTNTVENRETPDLTPETWQLLHMITATSEDARALAGAVSKWCADFPFDERSTAISRQVDILAAGVMPKH
jgi:hypothetical protein